MFVFGSGILYGIQTADGAGAAVANATPVQFGTMQDISGDISFEEKLLHGAHQMPVAFGRGKGKFEFKAKFAGINGAIMGDLLFGSGSSAGIKAQVQNFVATVPATPFQVTVAPPSSGTFVSDLGVLLAETGMPMAKVASAPSSGQYSVSAGGVYTFNTAQTGKGVLISYEYSASSTTARFGTISNQLMGYAPTFKAQLSQQYAGKSLMLTLNACVASKLTLPFKNDDFSLADFSFTAIADAANIVGTWATSE
jgi:hypothetical protein